MPVFHQKNKFELLTVCLINIGMTCGMLALFAIFSLAYVLHHMPITRDVAAKTETTVNASGYVTVVSLALIILPSLTYFLVSFRKYMTLAEAQRYIWINSAGAEGRAIKVYLGGLGLLLRFSSGLEVVYPISALRKIKEGETSTV